MKQFLSIVIFFSVLTSFVYANEAQSIRVHVEGMVCAFCAQGIEKRMNNIPGVVSVEVDLKTKVVLIQTDSATKISDAQLTAAVKEAGYNIREIQRPNAKTRVKPAAQESIEQQP